MKKSLVVLILLPSIMNFIYGQTNTVFVDSILNLVVSNQIPIYNEDLTEISFRDIEIIINDTVVCDEWTRPKYIDNVYYSAFDGSLIYSKNIFDTLTFQENKQYLQFLVKEYDDNGTYLGTRVEFLINRDKGVLIPLIEDSRGIITAKDEYWRNKEIRLNGQEISLDSCHLSYQISFFNDNSFRQAYSLADEYCFIDEMKNNINLGVEVQNKEQVQILNDFYNKVQGHYLSSKKGKWYVQDNELILWTVKRKPIIFEILTMTTKELILDVNSGEYWIKLVKENELENRN